MAILTVAAPAHANPERDDDRLGEGFREILANFRAEPRAVIDRCDMPRPPLRWREKRHGPDEPPVRSASVRVGRFRLLVAEMKDAFLAQYPPTAPKITWALEDMEDETEEICYGSPAPSFEEAQARAERALFVHLGIEANG